MKSATISEINKELKARNPETIRGICLRLAKYKKENKELLTYLLFDADHETAYVDGLKEEMTELFSALPAANLYLSKKTVRKILRFTNRQIKYSGLPVTELELRIHFCKLLKKTKLPLTPGSVLSNLSIQQQVKIGNVLQKLPEDLQFDYAGEIDSLAGS
jgi:hypothetical protein